ncbi:hypothetical protein EB796_023611 [Bugula neritina]|uniref:Uncharacterized protein n=1 Tax=Bugula neritina TaxID=10212 RepID=A0A7J7IW64_BUGNE|nr:hypothetical protein EB796_023611 [Bugula neritina]
MEYCSLPKAFFLQNVVSVASQHGIMAEVIKLPDQISSIQNVEVISKDVQITDDTKESLAVKEEPILSDQYPTENTNSVTAGNRDLY